MDFNRAEPTRYRTNFPYASFSYQNAAFSYIILRLTYIRGLILELGRKFPIGLRLLSCGCLFLVVPCVCILSVIVASWPYPFLCFTLQGQVQANKTVLDQSTRMQCLLFGTGSKPLERCLVLWAITYTAWLLVAMKYILYKTNKFLHNCIYFFLEQFCTFLKHLIHVHV